MSGCHRGNHKTDSSNYPKTCEFIIVKAAHHSNRPKLIRSSAVSWKYITTQRTPKLQEMLLNEDEPKCMHVHSYKGKIFCSRVPTKGSYSPKQRVRAHSLGKYPWTASQSRGRVSQLQNLLLQEGLTHLGSLAGLPLYPSVNCGHSNQLPANTRKGQAT